MLANALTCALTIASRRWGLIAANKTPEGCKISQAIPIFLAPSVVPEHFFRLRESKFCERYRVNRCALGKSGRGATGANKTC